MNRRSFFLTIAAVPLALAAKPKPKIVPICHPAFIDKVNLRIFEERLASYNTWYKWDEGPWRHYD